MEPETIRGMATSLGSVELIGDSVGDTIPAYEHDVCGNATTGVVSEKAPNMNLRDCDCTACRRTSGSRQANP